MLSVAVAVSVITLLTVLPLAGAVSVTVGAVVSPACVIVNVLPASVIVPVRVLLCDVGATINVTLPSPVPLAGDTVIHEALETAVHVHVESLSVIVIVPELPKSGIEALLGEIVDTHGAAV